MSGNVSKIEELNQCAELVGTVAKAMALIAPKMTKQARQSWIGLPPADFARVLEQQVFLPAQGRLSAPTLITLPAASAPQRLADRKDVQLFGRAPELFGSVNKKSPAMPEHTVERRDLEDDLDDFEIIAELGGEDVAVSDSVEETDDTIGRLIDAQPGGISSDLLTDGCANIFFVRDPENPGWVLYVRVLWHRVHREWFVDCSAVIDVQWSASDRVFPATAA